MMYRYTVLRVAMLHLLVMGQEPQESPHIRADGKNLILSAPGTARLEATDSAGGYTTKELATTNMVESVKATFTQMNATMVGVELDITNLKVTDSDIGVQIYDISSQLATAREQRIQLNASLTKLTETFTQEKKSAAIQIDELTTIVNVLVSKVNQLASCDEATQVCTPKLSTCSMAALAVQSNGVITLDADHDETVIPVGTLALFACDEGYFIEQGTARTATCLTSGTWTSKAPTCKRCLTGCATCQSATTCDTCEDNLSVDISGTYNTLTLDPTLVDVDPRGLNPFLLQGNTKDNLLINAKRLMVDGKPNPGAWIYTPSYERFHCADPAWVQVDVGKLMRIGSVTVWHYWGGAPRQYCGERIAVSETGYFNGEEIELHTTGLDFGQDSTGDGLTVSARGVTGRYIRHWAAGSTANTGIHFIEVAVTATNIGSQGTTTCI